MTRGPTQKTAGAKAGKPATPGEILLEEFLKPEGLSQRALAGAIGVSPRRINEIVLGKRAITADTDLRLARYWGLSEGFFLRLQNSYDLRMQRRKMGDVLAGSGRGRRDGLGTRL